MRSGPKEWRREVVCQYVDMDAGGGMREAMAGAVPELRWASYHAFDGLADRFCHLHDPRAGSAVCGLVLAHLAPSLDDVEARTPAETPLACPACVREFNGFFS